MRLHKRPLFSSARRDSGTGNRPPLSSIIYNTRNHKKQKMSQSFSNNINSLNTINNFTVAVDRSDILAWLSPLNPKLRHQAIRDSREGNVGKWLLRTEEFRSWQAGSGGNKSDNAILFCYGDPGVGKTCIR